MQLSGIIRTTCPPARLAAMLSDPGVLSALLPANSEIGRTGDGTFAFTIRKALGPLSFNMPGTMTLTNLGERHDRKLVAHAQHLIGGKVDIALAIGISRRGEITVLNYDGEITASGIASRLLGDNQDRAQIALRNAFLRLKRQAEGGFRTADA